MFILLRETNYFAVVSDFFPELYLIRETGILLFALASFPRRKRFAVICLFTTFALKDEASISFLLNVVL